MTNALIVILTYLVADWFWNTRTASERISVFPQVVCLSPALRGINGGKADSEVNRAKRPALFHRLVRRFHFHMFIHCHGGTKPHEGGSCRPVGENPKPAFNFPMI